MSVSSSLCGAFFLFGTVFSFVTCQVLLVCIDSLRASEICSVGILFLFLFRNLIFGLDCC